jgi:hypothetical protein
VIAIRVHQPIYEKIQIAAANAQLSISEEAERRLARSIEQDENFEGALREKGFLPVQLDDGVLWAPPEMPGIFNLRISVDAATIADEMGCPGLQPQIQQALQKISQKRGIGK